MNCMMDCCYTENIDGQMLDVRNSNTISIVNTLVVNGFNITPASSPFTQATKLMNVDSAGIGALYVTFIGGDLRYAIVGSNNMLPPNASSASCYVKMLGAVSNTWSTSNGAVVTTL